MKNREVRENVKKKLEKILSTKIRKKANKTTKKERKDSINERKSRQEIKKINESYFASDEFTVEGLINKSRKIWYRIIENETKIKKLESESKSLYELLIIFISTFSGVMIGDLLNSYLELEQSTLQIVNILLAVIVGVIATGMIVFIYYYFLIPYQIRKRGNNRKIKKIQMENIELEIRQEVIQEKIYSIIQSRLDYGQNNDKEV